MRLGEKILIVLAATVVLVVGTVGGINGWNQWRIRKALAQSMTFNGVPMQTVGNVMGFSATVNSSGSPLSDKCVHGSATSNSSGIVSPSFTSIGTTVTYANAIPLSGSNTVGNTSNQVIFSSITASGMSGAVVTQSPLTILTINLFSPVLQTTPTTVYYEVCAV